ncbi:hypothetical protein ACR6C2_44935 [Streptomyces sp. INA 01156]
MGIGRKFTGGRRGKQVALQFTVDSKAEPEVLETLGTTLIPGTITVDGTEVPTDVIERSYTPQFRRVAEAESPVRKTRLDPIEPGVSVGSVTVSAGTIGCIVYDKTDGAPYVLSNWHVLQGPRGELGVEIVQPGPHDDNRVHRNRLGTLKRSHLGVAGTVRSPPSRTAPSSRRSSNWAWPPGNWESRSSTTRSSPADGPPASPTASSAASKPSPSSTTAARSGTRPSAASK